MNIDYISIGRNPPEEVNAIIEVPIGGEPIKYEMDKKAGTLVVKENSAWGLGPFFRRRGGESGDYLSIVYDPSRWVATVQIGDASLTDQFGDPDEMNCSTEEIVEGSQDNGLGLSSPFSEMSSPAPPL